MRKLLALALLLIAAAAPAQTPNLTWFWCVDVTLDTSLWDKPMYQMVSGEYVFMASRAFRVRIGPFATEAACLAYMNTEVASNYLSPDALTFVYEYVDLQGNPGTYAPPYSKLSPVPDATCTVHYLVPPGG